jgi:hypothetical protein
MLLCLCLIIASATAIQFELNPYNGTAHKAAVVVSGAARFTVLTDRIIRIEYDVNKRWENRASLAFLNRNLPVPKFTSTVQSGVLLITTNALQLAYQTGTAFSATTLNITVRSAQAFYHFGDSDTGNLLGTIRSLDELGGMMIYILVVYYFPNVLNVHSYSTELHIEREHHNPPRATALRLGAHIARGLDHGQ